MRIPIEVHLPSGNYALVDAVIEAVVGGETTARIVNGEVRTFETEFSVPVIHHINEIKVVATGKRQRTDNIRRGSAMWRTILSHLAKSEEIAIPAYA